MISRENNHPFSDRRAQLDIVVEIFPACLQLLLDAGFKILGSAPSPLELEGVIRLRIQGSGLPQQCGQGEPLIVLTIVQVVYGSQKICRIADITVLDTRLAS